MSFISQTSSLDEDDVSVPSLADLCLVRVFVADDDTNDVLLGLHDKLNTL